MTGSVLDGEDVMQEALFEAYRKLETFDASRALSPWLFRIAHNRCIDFLRRRRVREEAETASRALDTDISDHPYDDGIEPALERLVTHLPPMERACVLLKDVMGFSLEEVSDLVDSSAGAVKSALNRGRAKLATEPGTSGNKMGASPETLQLFREYIDRFNRHDWDGVRELASADARLHVTDCFAGRLADSPYFIEYERRSVPWLMTLGEVDGETVVLILREDPAGTAPYSAIRLDLDGGRVVGITDYVKTPWVLPLAGTVTTLGA